jgi:GxxExxY protein
MANLILKDEVYAVVGAAMEVYNQLGIGFLEPVYQEAMELEVKERKIPFKAQVDILVKYKNVPLKKYYVADLVCFEQIIVELKAIEKLTSREEAQLINYLKATGLQVGLLINFGSEGKLEWKRMVLTADGSDRQSARLLNKREAPYKIRED